MTTTRLREGHAELHQRLTNARDGAWPKTREEFTEMLADAADAVLRCPHEGCAYCYTVEKEAR